MDALRNFIQNIKPTMLNVQSGKKLTEDERKQIINFYLEVSYQVEQSFKNELAKE